MQCALLVNRCRAYITIYSVCLAADDKSNKECTHRERKRGGRWSAKKQYKYTRTIARRNTEFERTFPRSVRAAS